MPIRPKIDEKYFYPLGFSDRWNILYFKLEKTWEHVLSGYKSELYTLIHSCASEREILSASELRTYFISLLTLVVL